MTNNNEISPAQLEANRANAQKSTGPKTEEGKANARFNARRHGLTGQFYCMSAQDEDAYLTFESDLLKTLKPAGAYENQIAISIIQDHWRLNRSRATEFNLYGRGHDQRADAVEAPSENTHAAATMAETCRDDNRLFANIALYETRIHRMIVKNEKRLAELQTERKAIEKAAFHEAEILIRYADLTGATPDDVGLLEANDGEDVLVNGFVLSISQIRYKIRQDQHLANAKACADLGWNPNHPTIKRYIEELKAA
jgi:hypothetical protein